MAQINGTRVLVTTSTLAWGVNLPARRVAVLGVERGIGNEISPIDIKQMVGRAGRAGLDDRGDAYVMLPQGGYLGEFEATKARYETVPPLRSWMDDEAVLVFHLVAEMDSGMIRNPSDFVRWHSRSFAASQGNAVTEAQAEAVFGKLVEWKAIEPRRDSGGYRVTALGRISSWLYLHPHNVYTWARNLSAIEQAGAWDSDAALAWAIGSVPEGTLDYVSKDASDAVKLVGMGVKAALGFGLSLPGAVESTAVYHALSGTPMKELGSLVPAVRTVKADAERTLAALKLIDSMHGNWGQDALWEVLGLRLAYGVGSELLPLVRLPQVGAVRARKLWDTGFKSLSDIVDPDKTLRLRVVLGAKVAEALLERARALAQDVPKEEVA